MQYLLFGFVALLLFLVAAQTFAWANPVVLARQLRASAGVVALAGSGLLLLRGAGSYGFGLAALGAWLLFGRGGFSLRGPAAGGSVDSGQSSKVRTDHLEVELDHATGAMRGRVLKGFFKDRELEALRPVELAHLWSDCRFEDPPSAQILEAFLDRVHPSWREDMDRGRGEDHATSGAQGGRGDRRMSRAEALDILGLDDTATPDAIRHAHRELMLKLHPDRGGSHTLAAQVNAAKDVLLGE